MIRLSAAPSLVDGASDDKAYDDAAMIKLPRIIRLDPSDTFVFARAAEPGEWAVSGSFVFGDCDDPAALEQKQRVALRSGFLGIDSLGWSTLTIVSEATDADRQGAVARLATQLLVHFGAPDPEAAHRAAEDEIAFAASLCDHPLQTLLAVQRSIEEGGIRERFRTLKLRDPMPGADGLHRHARAFTFHEVDSDEEIAEQIDLRSLTTRERD